MNDPGHDKSLDRDNNGPWPKTKLNKLKKIIPFYSHEELASIMNSTIEDIRKYCAELAIKPGAFHEKKRTGKKKKLEEKIYSLKYEDSMHVLYLNDRVLFITYDKKRMDDFIHKKNIVLS